MFQEQISIENSSFYFFNIEKWAIQISLFEIFLKKIKQFDSNESSTINLQILS